MSDSKIAGLLSKDNKLQSSVALTKFTINGKSKSNYFIAISSYFLGFCEKKMAKLEIIVYYDQLKSYTFEDKDKKIEIKYNDNDKENTLILESKDLAKINTEITKYLKQIFTASELTKLNIEPTEPPKLDEKCTIPISRYLIKSHDDDKKKIDGNFMKTLQSQFKVLIPADPNNSEPTLYGAIINAKSIESVELDQYPTQLVDYKPQLPFLHLLVSDLNDTSFDDFFDYLSNDQKSITGLSLKASNLNEDHFKKLIDFAINEYTSLSIQNSSIPSQFFQWFEKDDPLKLKMLNLDNCPSINIDELVQHTTSLTSLSIASCNIELGVFIENLQDKNFENLEMLNLSTNNSGNISSGKTMLPPTLQVIDVSTVYWSKDSLLSFLKLLFEGNFKHGIKLNIGYAIVDSTDWPDITDYLKQCDPSQLTELNWTSNHIDSNFNTFLSKCTNLKVLTIDSCLDDSVNLEELSETIANLPSLTQLHAAGSDVMHIGPKISEFLSKLGEAKNLELIDIHSQKIELDGLKSVSDLVEANNSIKVINIDDCNLHNVKELLSFCNMLAKPQREIKVSYPDLELDLLKNADEAFSANDVKLLRNQLAALEKGTATYQKEAPPPEEEPEPESGKKGKDKKSKDKKAKDKKGKDKKGKGKDDDNAESVPEPPFYIFRIEENRRFPIYMNEELENQLKETVPEKEPRTSDEHQIQSDHDSEINNKIGNNDNSDNDNGDNGNGDNNNGDNDNSDNQNSQNDGLSDSNQAKPKSFGITKINEEDDDDEGDDKSSTSKSNKTKGKSKTNRKNKNEDEDEDDEGDDLSSGRKSSKAKRKSKSIGKNRNEDDEDDEDDLSSGRKSSKAKRKSKSNRKNKIDDDEEEEEDDLSSKRKSSKAKRKSKSNRKNRYDDEDEEEEEDDLPPKRKSSKANRKSKSNRRNRRDDEDEEEEEDDLPPKRKSSKANRKSKSNRRDDEDEEEEEDDLPPKRKSSKANKKSKSNRRDDEDEEEEEDDLPPKRKSSKANKKSKSNRKNRYDDDEEEEEDDLPPKRKSSKANRKSKSSRKNRNEDEEEEEDDLPPKRKSSKANRKSSRKNRNEDEEEEEDDLPPKRKSSKANRKSSRKNRRDMDDDEEEEEEKPRRKSKSNRKSNKKHNRNYEDEEEEDLQPKRKTSKANRKSSSRRDKNEESSDSDFARIKSKRDSKRESKRKPVMDSESLSESESSQQDARSSVNKKQKISSFADSAPKPKPDKYEQPNWTLPPQLSQRYDPQPVFRKLQKQYDLKVLRDAI